MISFILAFILFDGYRIGKNKYINHQAITFIRVIIWLLVAILARSILPILILELAVFWLLFDMGLNLYRKLILKQDIEILYIGKTAMIDKFFRYGKLIGYIANKMKLERKYIMLIIKILLIVLSTLIYLYNAKTDGFLI